MHDLTCVDIVGAANTHNISFKQKHNDIDLACFDPLAKVIYVGAFASYILASRLCPVKPYSLKEN